MTVNPWTTNVRLDAPGDPWASLARPTPADAGLTLEPDTSRERELGVYDGQLVMEGDGGRLVYDCQPESADGCLIPVPRSPVTYITKISVPSFDDGIQRLRNHMREPEDEPEPQA